MAEDEQNTTTTETTFTRWSIGSWAGWPSGSSDENQKQKFNSSLNTATIRRNRSESQDQKPEKSGEKRKETYEICPIFNGKGYNEWRQRLKLLFARKGLKRLLRETDEEINYQKLGEMERETQMEEYDSKQDRARCLIIERLDDYRLHRINPTLTALQIMKALKYNIYDWSNDKTRSVHGFPIPPWRKS